MALSFAAVGAKITASFVNAIVALVNRQGLTAIIPSSVSGTGVTVGAGGVVTLTAASSANINGIFSSTFDNYLIKMKITARSTATELTLKLTASGTANSANYSYAKNYGSTSSGTSIVATATSQTTGWQLDGGQQGFATIDLSVFSPALNEQTQGQTVFQNSTATVNGGTVGLFHNIAAVFDGVQIAGLAATNLTATIRIYGIANN